MNHEAARAIHLTNHPALPSGAAQTLGLPEALQALQAQKSDLRERLRRVLPDSSAIHEVGQRLDALRADGAFLLEAPAAGRDNGRGGKPAASAIRGAGAARGASAGRSGRATGAAGEASAGRGDQRDAAFFAWTQTHFSVGEDQCRKYLRVAQAFLPGEVVGKTLGIESLNQIALADLRLRPLLWSLAQDARLASGALAEGRLAGGRVLCHADDLDKALLAAERAARLRARRQGRVPSGGRAPSPAAQLAGVEQALALAAGKIEGLLQAETPPGDAAAQARVRAQVVALAAQCQRLLQRLGGEEGGADRPAEALSSGAEPPPCASCHRRLGGDEGAAEPRPAEALCGDATPKAAASEAGAPTIAADDALAALAHKGARFQPVIQWLLALPPARRELLLAMLMGVLAGLCPLRSMTAMLDQRIALWDEQAPPEPHFKSWRDALLREESRALTILSFLAAADPTQLLFMLPRLLELLTEADAGSCLSYAESELRALAARYGGTVASLRLAQQLHEELAERAKGRGGR